MFEDVWTVVAAGDLNTDGPCYPYALRGSANTPSGECYNAFYFHFACWVAGRSVVNGEPFTNFRVMLDVSEQPSPIIQVGGKAVYALFGKQEDRDAFASWVENYRTWFVDQTMENSLFPRLPTTGFHSLRFLPQQLDYDMGWADYPPEAFRQWAAITALCKSPVYVTNRSLAFVDEKEALLYKMGS